MGRESWDYGSWEWDEGEIYEEDEVWKEECESFWNINSHLGQVHEEKWAPKTLEWDNHKET